MYIYVYILLIYIHIYISVICGRRKNSAQETVEGCWRPQNGKTWLKKNIHQRREGVEGGNSHPLLDFYFNRLNIFLLLFCLFVCLFICVCVCFFYCFLLLLFGLFFNHALKSREDMNRDISRRNSLCDFYFSENYVLADISLTLKVKVQTHLCKQS